MKIITFNEWIRSDERINVHCATLEQLERLFEYLNENGKTWVDDSPYDQKSAEHVWDICEAEAVVDNKGCFGTLNDAYLYKEPVYEYSNIDFNNALTIANWFD